MTKILDCTTRDGGHTTNWNFDNKFVFSLIDKLNNFNVSYYEIGYRNHYDTENKGPFYNCSPDILKPFYENKGALELGVMTDTKRFSEQDFPNANSDYLDFVRVACHPDKIEETLNIAELLYSRKYKVFVQLMDISNVDTEGYIHLYSWKNKSILESLYFADSYGTITPEETEKYFNKLKILGFEKISFHGHNASGFALKNSQKAAKLGAYSIDVTQDGIGRSGGNLDFKYINTVKHF